MHIAFVAIFGNILLVTWLAQGSSSESYLYLQDAASASIQKQDDGTATLTLTDAPETLSFSNHPYRDATNEPTDTFTKKLDISPKDPLNAILQVKKDGNVNNIFLDIHSASTSDDNLTTTYEVTLLKPEKGSNIMDPSSLFPTDTFQNAVLFIDSPTVVRDNRVSSLILNDGKQDIDTMNSGIGP